MNIAVFASGGGSNFRAILDKIKSGDLKNAEIRAVISNNSKAGALEIARKSNIPAIHMSGKTHPETKRYEKEMLELLEQYNIELILMAGYMKLLPSAVISRYSKKVLNIHPALLPRFGGKNMYGMNVHKAVLESGEKWSGPTVHYANEKYDEGTIIRQAKVPVLNGDTPEILGARVLKAEHDLYWRVIDEMVNGSSS
ncbi:MAG: phosphoribosylglycinamide formyltransferase [bacterium]